MKENYKLIGLQIENLRLIKAAYLKFKPSGLTQIVGRNATGKSTVIDAIEILFEGFKRSPEDIITHGKEKAVIIGELDDFIIKRVITNKTNRLEVITKAGFRPQKPQDFLNALINKLTFRPQVFLDKKPEEKLRFLMEILNLDFTEENRKIAEKENERLFVGRELKSLGEMEMPEKIDPVDINLLLKEKQEITLYNEKEKQKQSDINFFQTLLRDIEFKCSNNDRPAIKTGFEKIKKTINDIISSMPLPEFKDTTEIDSKISQANDINRKAQLYSNFIEWNNKKTQKQAEYDRLNEEIKELREAKVKKLKEVKMPVEGLEIRELKENEYGLFYKDIFCENWARSLGWKIALSICAAMQPSLKAIFLDNGETLDEDSRKALDKWAIENNIQVILTVVQNIPDELTEGTFYVEEGKIFTSQGDCLPDTEEEEEDNNNKTESNGKRPKINPQELF